MWEIVDNETKINAGNSAFFEWHQCNLTRNDGDIRYIHWHASPVADGINHSKTICCFIRDVTEERLLRENMQFYVSAIMRIQENERKRIARDLHDVIAQSLATLLLDIDKTEKTCTKNSLSDVSLMLQDIRIKFNDLLKDIRRFSSELRPDILGNL